MKMNMGGRVTPHDRNVHRDDPLSLQPADVSDSNPGIAAVLGTGKQKLIRLFFGLTVSTLAVGANAQFVPGQLATAAQFNAAFAAKAPVNNAVFTGTTTIPGAAITGGTIVGLSAPIPLGSGGTGATSATGATSQLQYLQGAAGSVARSLTNKFQDTINLKDFGGPNTCNGTNNDDAAMTSAFAAIGPGLTLTLPSGTCTFTTAKVLPLISNGGIRGQGSGQTTLLYTGTNTTNDLISLGDGTASLTGWNFSGFTIQSSTKMTAGAALHLKRMRNGNSLYDVNAGSFTQPSVNLWKGIWLDNVNVFKYNHGNIQVQSEGLDMNGSAASDEGSDIFLDNLAVTFSAVGFHVGGGQGGVYFGKTLAFDNNVNYRIDNGIVSRMNREIFFSDEAISDGNTNYGIHINDTLTSNSPIVINAQIASAGLFGSGGAGINVYVQSWPNGRISFGPGQLYNATTDALRVDDSTTQIAIDPGRFIFNNGGYAVNATASNSNISNLSQFMSLNTSGNYSGNVHLIPFTVNTNVTAKPVSGTSSLTLDNAGSLQSVVLLNDNGLNKWQVGKNTNNHFFAYDTAGGNYVWDMPSGGPFTMTPLAEFSGGIQLPVSTVSSLPSCGSSQKGMMYAVSDATSPTYNGSLTGGGSVSVAVYCNGSSWTAH